jgi:hypothetical protein
MSTAAITLGVEPLYCQYLDCAISNVTAQCPIFCGGGGWIDGGEERNCSIGCSERGLACYEADLMEHNSDVDSSEKVWAMIETMNWTFSDNNLTECSDHFLTGAAVPNFAHQICYYSGADRAADTYNCGKAPQDAKHRLCWCSPKVPTACESSTEGWYDSGEKEGCVQVCENCGLQCTEEQLMAHNADVDTDVEVRAIVTALGGTTAATNCNPMYGTALPVPNWNADACYQSQTDRNISTYSCAAVPGPGKHRMCYCHPPIPTTTTITGTPRWNVLDGPCQRVDNGQCIQSPNYPAPYQNAMHCEIAPAGSFEMVAVAFNTEEEFDTLTVNGVAYHGTDGAALTGVVPSVNIVWTSDYGATHEGWKFCTQVVGTGDAAGGGDESNNTGAGTGSSATPSGGSDETSATAHEAPTLIATGVLLFCAALFRSQ